MAKKTTTKKKKVEDIEVSATIVKPSTFSVKETGPYRLEAKDMGNGIFFWAVTKNGMMVAGSGYEQGNFGQDMQDACDKAIEACQKDATLYRIPVNFE